MLKQTLKLSIYNIKKLILETFLISLLIGIIIIPLLSFLFIQGLDLVGISTINLNNIKTIFFQHILLIPLTLSLLFLFVTLVYTQFTYIFFMHDSLLKQEKFSRKNLIIKTWTKIKNITCVEFILVFLYIIILTPITGTLFRSNLTKKIAIPSFITSELMKSPETAIIFWITYAILFLFAYKLMFMLPSMILLNKSPKKAISYTLKKTFSFKNSIKQQFTSS
jgi:glycerophosphoryl diester phosphodiesterase